MHAGGARAIACPLTGKMRARRCHTARAQTSNRRERSAADATRALVRLLKDVPAGCAGRLCSIPLLAPAVGQCRSFSVIILCEDGRLATLATAQKHGLGSVLGDVWGWRPVRERCRPLCCVASGPAVQHGVAETVVCGVYVDRGSAWCRIQTVWSIHDRARALAIADCAHWPLACRAYFTADLRS